MVLSGKGDFLNFIHITDKYNNLISLFLKVIKVAMPSNFYRMIHVEHFRLSSPIPHHHN